MMSDFRGRGGVKGKRRKGGNTLWDARLEGLEGLWRPPMSCVFVVFSRENTELEFLELWIIFVYHLTVHRCKRWIQLCGRPIPPEKIDRNSYICSDHFPINEVLDWKKNPKLDPIPFHRLKKVTREEALRQVQDRNPHSVFYFWKI